ncbi:hypothetical protein IC006_0352 [Sulfuracidifex tepidarius]|uniref:Uncharacterized protein n=1 Tax=Sulfuracidifex tepidarius TaxID=1294262 RepID=A0A510DSB7_9CREN|nr:hypothetical protein [Sulfuracidifex tepidarius]BBG23068.1 hypothetical protein IC006_0352 [Sulfuracidifex tepidarius]
MNGNNFLKFVSIGLVVVGIILTVFGTTTYIYPREQFDVNGMIEITGNSTPNYFVNFIGLAILLFGVGGLISVVELQRIGKGVA